MQNGEIKLTDEYSIQIDAYNYTLRKNSSIIGYFPDLYSCIAAYVKEYTRERVMNKVFPNIDNYFETEYDLIRESVKEIKKTLDKANKQ